MGRPLDFVHGVSEFCTIVQHEEENCKKISSSKNFSKN
jgi:hypothetical protein